MILQILRQFVKFERALKAITDSFEDLLVIDSF